MDFYLSDCFGSGLAMVNTLTLVATVGGALLGGLVLKARRVVAFVRWGVLPWLAVRRIRQQIATMPVAAGVDDLAEGRQVRLHGTVVRGEVAAASISGAPAVVHRQSVQDLSGRRIDEGISARSFSIALADGEVVDVEADLAARAGRLRLADAGEDTWSSADGPLAGALLAESRVAVGTQVEIVGRVTARPDPTVVPRTSRQLPRRWTVGPGEAPLVLAFSTRQASRTHA